MKYNVIPIISSQITLGELEQKYLSNFLLIDINKKSNDYEDYLFDVKINREDWKLEENQWKQSKLIGEDVFLAFYEYTPISILQFPIYETSFDVLQYLSSLRKQPFDKSYILQLYQKWNAIGFRFSIIMHDFEDEKEARIFYALLLTIIKEFDGYVVPNVENLSGDKYNLGTGLYSFQEFETMIKEKVSPTGLRLAKTPHWS